MLERDYTALTRRSIDARAQLAAALAAPAAFTTPLPDGNALAAQLRMVARTIAARQAIGVRRQVFLVGAGGFAYEEAAEICGCAVGTIKSRVARGRVALEQLLSSGKLPSRRQHKSDPDKSALQTIMGEVDDLSRDHG